MGNTSVIDSICKSFSEGNREKSKKLLSDHVLSLTPEDVNKKFDGKTLLVMLVEKEDVEMIGILLQNMDVDVNIDYRKFGEKDILPLVTAVEMENFELLEILLKAPNIHVNQSDSKNRFALNVAIEKGNMKFTEAILCHPLVDTSKSCYTKYAGETKKMNMVALAVKSGNFDLLKLVIEHIDQKYVDGKTREWTATPLSVAIHEGNLEIVEYLVNEKCVSVEASGSLGSPLEISKAKGFDEITNLLEETIQLPILYEKTCKVGNLVEVKRLLSLPRVDVSGEYGRPLEIACSTRNFHLLDLLLSHHVDLSEWRGPRALCILCDGEIGALHVPMIRRLLIEEKVDPYVETKYKNRRFDEIDALGLLCYYGGEEHMELCEFLLKNHPKGINEQSILYRVVLRRDDGFWSVRRSDDFSSIHELSYLSTALFGRNRFMFEHLCSKYGDQIDPNLVSNQKFSIMSLFLDVLIDKRAEKFTRDDSDEASRKKKEGDDFVSDEQAKMFRILYDHPKTVVEEVDIGYSQYRDPFHYSVSRGLRKYANEILQSEKFKVNQELHKTVESSGVLRTMIKAGPTWLDTLQMFLRRSEFCLSGDFGKICVIEAADLDTRKCLCEYILKSSEGDLTKKDRLHYACQASDYEQVKELVIEDENVSAEDLLINSQVFHMTPTFVSVKNRDTKLLEILLSHPKVDVNKLCDIREPGMSEEDLATPLMIGCMNGNEGTPVLPVNLEIVKMLLAREEIDVGYKPQVKGGSALFLSCLSHAPSQVVEGLIAHPIAGSSLDINEVLLVSEENEYSQTNLLAATICHELFFGEAGKTEDGERNELEIVRLILSQPSFNVNKLTGATGFITDVHPLVLAGKTNKMGIVREILKHENVDVNVGTPSPFEFCKQFESVEFLVRILCHRSFDPEIIPVGGEDEPESKEKLVMFLEQLREKVKEFEEASLEESFEMKIKMLKKDDE